MAEAAPYRLTPIAPPPPAPWKMAGAPSATPAPDNSSLTPDSFMATQAPTSAAASPAALTPDSFMATQSAKAASSPSALDQLETVPGKVWRAIKPIADVTTPAIGYQMYRKLTHQPNDLASVPEKATLAFVGMDVPEMGEGAEPIAEAQAQNAPQRGASLASRAPASSADASVLDNPAVSPWVDAAKKEVMKVPGANLAKTAYDSLHGLFFGDGEGPAAPTPSVPPQWGKGTYGTPVAQWGTKVGPTYPGAPLPENPGEFPGAPLPEKPPAEVLQAQPLATGAQPTPASPAAALGNIPAPWKMKPQAAALGDVPTPTTQPAAQTGEALADVPIAPWRMKPQAAALGDSAPAKATISQQLDDTLRTAVGNQPLKPGVPIRYQFKNAPATASAAAEGSDAAAAILEGHTPVEGSSAVKSFMYDPDAQEMHIAPIKGYAHVYGDVSPDQAQAFQDAESKGRAWRTLRNSPGVTPVAKIMENGTRVAIKPTDAGEDLTGQLQDSVAAVNKAKWRTKKIQ
jgi:hypothetical protein